MTASMGMAYRPLDLDLVRTCRAVEHNCVLTGPAIKRVLGVASNHAVVSFAAENRIGTGTAIKLIISFISLQRVIPVVTEEPIVAAWLEEHIRRANQDIISWPTVELGVPVLTATIIGHGNAIIP